MNAPMIPPAWVIRPLKRISPSRVAALQECILREVLSASGCAPLLPTSPRAKLGQAAHTLIELAGKNAFGRKSKADIESKWGTIVAAMEQVMASSWLERSLIPLSSSVPDYQVLRLRAINKAWDITQRWAACSGKAKVKGRTFFESWVQSTNGVIGGFLDEIWEGPEGAVIRDYKTGYILDRNGVASPQVKDAYVAQMQLYAGLYHSQFGRWPKKLELIPMQGETIDIPVDVVACDALIQKATSLLSEVNSKIEKVASESLEQQSVAIGTPGARVCAFCAFRPGCAAYKRERFRNADQSWPNDVRGTLTDIQRLGNGKLLLSIRGTNGERATIRGVTADPQRHPGLANAQIEEPIEIYNLKGQAEKGSLGESALTAIYNSR